MADRIQHRRDTAARWTEINPVLLEGEIGYVLDNPNQHKIGDGEHAWNDLPLRGFTGNITQSFGDDENAVVSQKVVTEEKRRTENAEKKNSDAIAAEVTRAQEAEQTLAQAISGVAGRVTAIEGGYATDVELYEEEERAKAAEQANAAAIAAEVERAEAKEQELSGEIESNRANIGDWDKAMLGTIAEQVDSINGDVKVNQQDIAHNAEAIEAEAERAKAAEDDLNANTGISEYPVFDPAKDYAVGDVVKYEGRLYRFTAEHAQGEWIGTDVEKWSERKEIEGKVTELGKEVEFSEENSSTIFSVEDAVTGYITEGKFIRWHTGEIEDSSSGFSLIVWDIDANKTYAITATTIGAATALAVYKDADDNYIAAECVAKSGIATHYYKRRLNIPKKCVKIYFSSYDSYVKTAILQPINYAKSIQIKETVENIEKRIEDNHKEVSGLISEETERAISSENEIRKSVDSLMFEITGEVYTSYDYNEIDNWEIGNISNGVNTSNNSRIRTIDFFTIQGQGYNKRTSLDKSVLESYSAVIYVYDRDKNYLGNKSLQTSTASISDSYPTAKYYRVCAYNFVSNLDNILDNVQYMSVGEEVSTVCTSIDENKIEPRLTKVEEEINPLKGKRILFAGDSVMAATANDGGWARLIGEKNRMDWKNIAVGGSTIRRMTDGRKCILDDIKGEEGEYDYIIIQGGLNDASNKPSTLNGAISDGYEDEWDVTKTYPAMEELCRYALTHYANKKVGFLISYIRGTGTASWMTYADNLIKICEKWGMPYLDLRKCAGFNLANLELREIYGNYLGASEAYNATKGYAIDDIVNYGGKRYKANDTIVAPAGEFDEERWTYIGTDYDAAHCNMAAYRLSAPRIESWMKSL